MSGTRAAYRYAKAFITWADKRQMLDEVITDFRTLERLVSESREFLIFLKSPIINAEKKTSILSEFFTGKLSEPTLLFLKLLTKKNRENLLHDILLQFNRLMDEKFGIINVTVQTAVQFTQKQEEKVIEHLEKVTKSKIRLKYILNPSLIGGFTIHFDDTVWDGSVKHQLDVLRKILIQ